MNQDIFKIDTYLTLSSWIKAKKYYLNLNNYRNWHYIVSNNLKKKFKEQYWELLKWKKYNKIEIEYTLYSKDNRKRDKWNVLCIAQKFFLDMMTELWIITDDNDEFIKREIFNSSKKDIDKKWYVEIKIIEIEGGG